MPRGKCVRGPLAGGELEARWGRLAYFRDSRHLGDYRWVPRLSRWRWSALRDDDRERFVVESGGAAGGAWGSDTEFEAQLRGHRDGPYELPPSRSVAESDVGEAGVLG